MKFSDFLNDPDNDNSKPEICLMNISEMKQAKTAADLVKTAAVIVKINADTRMKILNIRQFLEGAVYMENGNLEEIGENTILIAPNTFKFTKNVSKSSTAKTDDDQKNNFKDDQKRREDVKKILMPKDDNDD